jgi:hypothetical protein
MLDELGRIRRTRVCEIKPGSTEVLDKSRMITDFKEMLLPDQRRLAGWLAVYRG